MDENSATKNCAYPGCENTTLSDSQFEYCDVCRTLSLRNAHAILIDPTAPISDRANMIFAKAISLQKPEETLNAVHKIEWLYLEYQKVSHSFKMEEHRKLRFNEAMGEVENERRKANTPKLQKKKEKRESYLKTALGDKYDELMKGDLNDL